MSNDQASLALRDHPQWVFVWASGRPYATSIVGWTRTAVIVEVEKTMGQPWTKTYRRGGRVIRFKMVKP